MLSQFTDPSDLPVARRVGAGALRCCYGTLIRYRRKPARRTRRWRSRIFRIRSTNAGIGRAEGYAVGSKRTLRAYRRGLIGWSYVPIGCRCQAMCEMELFKSLFDVNRTKLKDLSAGTVEEGERWFKLRNELQHGVRAPTKDEDLWAWLAAMIRKLLRVT